MQSWRKLGLIYDPARSGLPWMRSHCQLPVADHHHGNVYRVYFASRDEHQVSRIGWAAVELNDGVRVLEVSTRPVLEPGAIGTFDEHGVFPSCITNLPDRKRMYYIGWNRGERQPLFYASIGLAESTDGGESWKKCSTAPIMARSEFDPCLVTSPHVMRHAGRYRMTYVSGIRWEELEGRLVSYYHIKYAESDDGVQWRRDGRIAIDFALPIETNVARSWVVADGDTLRMWFCYVRKGTAYRIGYAESTDYLSWTRDDSAAAISVSEAGWDDEMICYPNVVVHKGRNYMFYNGNQFGENGFGAAVSN
jgi:predicted GH43/DUF377 family glycosyl hydrolase